MSTVLYLLKKNENQQIDSALISLFEKKYPAFVFQKYLQIKHKNYKLDYTLVRLLLLYGLQEYGISDFKDLYEQTVEGKPFLRDSTIHFSLTHSSEFIGVAVSKHEVGLDLEKDKEFNFRRISSFLTDLENIFLENNPDKFFELWTQKEAIVKLEGVTLAQMRDYCVIKNRAKYFFHFYNEEKYKICLALKNESIVEVKKISMAEISSTILL